MTAAIDVEEVLAKLNNPEKVSLLAGRDWWQTVPLPKYGVPSIRVSDGPNGIRGSVFFNGVKAACFPCGTALGATWDVELLRKAGVLMGEEAKVKGVHVILGPTVNMQRSPLGGRGFESFGEDPILAGYTASAIVNGIQDTHVVATIKHFVCNDQEHERNETNAIVTERALREIYALPFQIAVKESNPGAFMTAYNKVNGRHVSEEPKIVKDMLRGEWGWNGLVMSDWWGTYSTSGAANAGLDLEMPGPAKWRGENLLQAVGVGKVTQVTLDERARNVLNLVNRVSKANIPEFAPEETADTPETAALLRKIGAESIVLMKNENNILPLRKDKKTLVMGPNAKYAAYHGGGSAALAAYYAVTPFDGIASQLGSPPQFTQGCYAHKELPLIGHLLKTESGDPGMVFSAFNEPPEEKNREAADIITLTKTELMFQDYKCPKLNDKDGLWFADVTGEYVSEEDQEFEFGLTVFGSAKLFVNDELLIDNNTKQTKGTSFFMCGTVEEKGRIHLKKGQKYRIKVEFESAVTSKLDPGSNVLFSGGAVRIGGAKVMDADEEVKHAAALAKDADQVIICAGLNSDWEGEGSDRENMALPGHMNALIAAVTEANPSTVVVMQSGTPVEMPWISSTNALIHAWYGGNETGNAIADILFGNVNPSAKLPLSFPKRLQDNPAFLNYRTERGRTLYGEDVYVGYRWYEMLDMPVTFPFGHGLSYTKFTYEDLKIAADGEKLSVSVTLKNVGEIDGAEVVQVYISQRNPSIRRPKKELKGFEKVLVAKGESKSIEVKIELKYATSFWDEIRNAWISEKDTYDVIVGGSSDDTKSLRGNFDVSKTSWWNGL